MRINGELHNEMKSSQLTHQLTKARKCSQLKNLNAVGELVSKKRGTSRSLTSGGDADLK
jgi:hypothetical protein